MIFKQFEWRILVRVLLLFITLSGTSFLLVKELYVYLLIAAPIILYQVVDFYRFHKKAHDELNQFVESIHYRDFSRNFDVKHAPVEIQPLRQGFNEINTTFKVISKEKETQYQYLQKILELVDTGILSYEEESGKVVWMNESLKSMLQLPYLKTIHSLSKRDELLYQQILVLKPGDGRIATAHLETSSFKILISATAFQTEGKKFKLIAFQNVNEALDETESRAWQKLLSVLTHEIMNSVAPISSLADTLKHRLQQSVAVLSNESGSVDDLELGIETIKRRSEGLLKFAETILKDPDLSLEADTNLLEQVLINLLVNAIEAVREKTNPKIVLSAYLSNNRKTIIRVADNGSGMPAEILEKIFIPFFSTKKSGSGIGLSLCKQIMMLHKGNIQVQSVDGEGTAFLLQF
jgi:signal transduction histidine kinase